MIAKSKEWCPFCPERIFEKVPKFEGDIGKNDGRIVRGESVFFPNLNPFAGNHAVGVISSSHFLDVNQYTPSLLRDSISASLEYIRSVSASSASARFPGLVWNFLPPSAGSIIHPHVQVFVEDEPVPQVDHYLTRSAEYFGRTQRNFFADLRETEKSNGERWLGENDSVFVFTTFAPRGFNEVSFVFKNVSALADLTEKQVDDFVALLLKVLAGYHSVGVGSFNLVSFSAASAALTAADSTKGTPKTFWLTFKLFSRPFPKGVYTNDTGPMERMYDAFVIDSPPEMLAESLRPFVVGEGSTSQSTPPPTSETAPAPKTSN